MTTGLGLGRHKWFKHAVYAVLFLNMVWPCTCEGKFCFSHLTYYDSDMIFQFFCSLFVVTRYDVTDV